MKSVKVSYKRLHRFLKSLQDEWTANRPKRHAQATAFLIAQLANRPGLTAHQYLPVILRYAKDRGVQGIDGVILTAISAAAGFSADQFRSALEVADGFSPREADTKVDFSILFVDLSRSNNPVNALSPAVRGLLGIRGSGIGSTLPIAVETSGGFKAHNAMMSQFADAARNSYFSPRGFGIVGNRFSSPSTFGQQVRQIGNGQAPENPALGSWVSDTKETVVEGFRLAFGVYGAMQSYMWGGSRTIKSTDNGIEFEITGNPVESARTGWEFGRSVGDSVGNVVTGIAEGIGDFFSGLSGDEEDDSDAGTADGETNDADASTVPDDNYGEDPSLGVPADPDDEETYPVPEGRPSVGATEEQIGAFLASCFGGRMTVPKGVVMPNPESMGSNHWMLHNVTIDRRDHYVYPSPTATDRKSISEEEFEDRVRRIVNRVVNPGWTPTR